MEHIVEKVFKRIVEATEKDLMKLEAGLVISTNYQISDILTTIRAFSGVTIVSPGGDTVKMGELKERSTITMKIVPPADLEEYITLLREKIAAIPGILSFKMRPIRN
jgi:hypothetical protein|tara:strand:+ start:140 stop:460 length:321 start_codon:yes stop_codon:yes gene_type:complete